MLFPQPVLERIATGEITLAFRRWKRPTVRAGGRLRTGVGELKIEAVGQISEAAITESAARSAGCESRAALLAQLSKYRDGALYRIQFHVAGEDSRIALREQSTLTEAEFSQLQRKLGRFDASSRCGPWTAAILELIAAHPEVRAVDLAGRSGFEKEWLKVHIRKLKEVGLTESLASGYRLAPRGKAYLSRLSAGGR